MMQNSQIDSSKTIKILNIFGQPMMIFGLPVDQKTIFSNHKGVYKKGIEKRQRKLIVKTAFIKWFLKADERIFCLTSGYSPITFLEQIFTGLAFLFFKRVIFAFTDTRLLHIPVRLGAKSPSAISQILYKDCIQISLKGRTLTVQYKDGRYEYFPYIGRREKKKIAELLNNIPFRPEVSTPSKSRHFLCPSCANTIADDTLTCPTCQLKFKSKPAATVLSIAVPGGGYFYSRYTLLGIFFALFELFLMGFITILSIDISNGLPAGYGLLALLTGGLILEKGAVTFHARQLIEELIPSKKKFTVHKILPPSQKKSQ